MAVNKTNFCRDCGNGPLSWGSKRCRGCAGKRRQIKLWNDPEYREKQSEAHKGNSPKNLTKLIAYAKSEAGRKSASDRMKGKVAWNKGKIFEAIRGENHYNWRGGKGTKRHRDMGRYEYINWRSLVFMRDKYTCQECGAKGVYLMAHHIKPWVGYPKLRYKLSNGKTVCEPCHASIDKHFAQFYVKGRLS